VGNFLEKTHPNQKNGKKGTIQKKVNGSKEMERGLALLPSPWGTTSSRCLWGAQCYPLNIPGSKKDTRKKKSEDEGEISPATEKVAGKLDWNENFSKKGRNQDRSKRRPIKTAGRGKRGHQILGRQKEISVFDGEAGPTWPSRARKDLTPGKNLENNKKGFLLPRATQPLRNIP